MAIEEFRKKFVYLFMASVLSNNHIYFQFFKQEGLISIEKMCHMMENLPVALHQLRFYIITTFQFISIKFNVSMVNLFWSFSFASSPTSCQQISFLFYSVSFRTMHCMFIMNKATIFYIAKLNNNNKQTNLKT